MVMLEPPPEDSGAIITAYSAGQRGPPSPGAEIGVNLRISFQGGSHGEYPGRRDRSQPFARRKHRIHAWRPDEKRIHGATLPVMVVDGNPCNPRRLVGCWSYLRHCAAL